MTADDSSARVLLSDLRRARAADASLENLLRAITAKIEDCAKLAVFEYEAGSEGHQDLAIVFRDLANVERETFNTLLDHLRRHLNERPAEAPKAPRFPGSAAVGER